MNKVVIEVQVTPTSVSVPMESFVGLPKPGSPGQFLGFDYTWQYPDSAASTITRQADGALSGHRVVYARSLTDVAYPDQSDYAQVQKILGITTSAAADGDDVVIQDKGFLIEPSWSWSEGDVWLADNGQLTQNQPTSGCLVRIGSAMGATALLINIDFIINL